jgi:eukaryotic-like serine/threonine-protein kinase
MTPSLPESHVPTATRFERLEALFWAAVNIAPGEREQFLSVECRDNPDLRHELQRMLAASERAGAFLEVPLPEVLASDLPQASVARWKLLERVGEGGLGVVYRAECIEDGVKLEAAVKILRPGLDTGKFREKFMKERQILAGLDHPGIVRLMDCGADSYGRSFMVMEFIQGEPLNTYLERVNPAIPQRLELFELICEAVSYLHSRLIIHGDIKPANVLVTPAGIPKLVDFGASSLLAANAVVRGELTQLMLTPQYAGPEQLRGEGPSVPGDIYSLGRLLEEILPTAAKRSDVRYILERAMAERPAERYLCVSDLLEDLRRLQEGLPLRTRPATFAYVLRRFLRRNWVAALLTVLLVISLACGWWRAERASRRASAAASEALRQHQSALAHERRALENEARADSSAREAALNAARLDALVGDLIDEEDADPNIVGQPQEAAERSLRRAAASLETLPGLRRWRELSILWRRLAMLLAHRGQFTAAEAPLEKARVAAAQWISAQPSPESRRNALMVKLCELRFARQRGTTQTAYRLAHEALADFRGLPPVIQAELNGTVWLENARLSIARELIDRNGLEPVPDLLTQVVRNSHSRNLTQTRDLAVANLVWSFRRLNRLNDARHWCGIALEWQVADLRVPQFCAEPLTALTGRDPLFPAMPGALSDEGLQSILSRINQLIQDLHEDPRSFPLNLTLGRAYARLAEHYLATGQTGPALPAVRKAAAIRDTLVAGDSKSPVVLNFKHRVDALEHQKPAAN